MANIFDLFKKIETGSSSQPITHIVVGLGNVGKEYEGTRHNVGFMAIDHIAKKIGVKIDMIKFNAYTAEGVIGGKRTLLMKPTTFMNLSGVAISEAANFYKIPPERCLIICDDITLPVGTIRLRRKGSDGGQRGMRSIITLCGSEAFPRIKVGVGQKPHPDYDLAAWVLSRFTKEEAPLLLTAACNAADAAQLIAQDRMDDAMNRFSR